MKRTALLIALGLLLALGGVLTYKHLNPRLVSTSDISHLYTVDDLVEASDLIVRVHLRENVSQVLEKDDQGLPYNYYTFSTIQVLHRYRGTSGDTLSIVEPYAVWRQIDGAQILSTGGYVPLKRNDTYLIFLAKSKQHPKSYEVVGHLQGRFVVTSSREADPDPVGADHYKKLREDVMRRFPN